MFVPNALFLLISDIIFVFQRMDEISISEELDVVVDNSFSRLSCGQVPLSNLENLVMEDFRAGGSELALASAIMKYSIRLKTISLCVYPRSSQDFIKKAVIELRSREKASSPSIVGNFEACFRFVPSN